MLLPGDAPRDGKRIRHTEIGPRQEGIRAVSSGGSVLRHTGTRSVVVRAMSAMPDQSYFTPER